MDPLLLFLFLFLAFLFLHLFAVLLTFFLNLISKIVRALFYWPLVVRFFIRSTLVLFVF